MRKDQIEALDSLTEKLADVVLSEADPDVWPGKGKQPVELTREERGDRYWCKRNAAATLSLLERVQRTMTDALTADPLPRAASGESDLDKDISRHEKEAAAMLDRIQKKSAAVTRGK